MTVDQILSLQPALADFLAEFADCFGRAEPRHHLERYVRGQLSHLQRKSVEPIALLNNIAPRTLQEFLSSDVWDHARARDRLQQIIARDHEDPKAIGIIDDSGHPKSGKKTAGVQWQYCGRLGKTANCVVTVQLAFSSFDTRFRTMLDTELYLPESWTEDPARCRKAKVPEEIAFATKGEIALALIDQARNAGIEPRAAVTDAGYGDQPPFLDGLEARELAYAAAVGCEIRFRLAAALQADPGDPPPPARRPKGRPRKKTGLEDRVAALPAEAILAALPEGAWQDIAWRQGSKGALVKQFARVCVHRTGKHGRHLQSCGWLIGERPLPGHSGDAKYCFAWGLNDLSLKELVELVHVRWVIERFYQDAKGELGLDDYEGRLWHGFQRHVALVMLAHCFLTLQQSYGPAVFEPSRGAPARGFPPRGAKKSGRAAAQGA